VPENAGGDGAPRFPRGAHFFEFFGRRAFAKAFHFLDGDGERQITDGPDVRTAQSAHEVDIGGPCADAFQFHQLFAGVTILKFVQFVQREPVLLEGFGEEAGVESFLATETHGAEFDVGQFQESGWSERLYCGLKFIEECAGGGQGDLLLQNDVEERWKSGLPYPERGYAVFFHDRRQIAIDPCQFADAASEEFFGENDSRSNLRGLRLFEHRRLPTAARKATFWKCRVV
jgi:hypothetical protein